MKLLLLIATLLFSVCCDAQEYKDLYSLNVHAGKTDIGTIYKVGFQKAVSNRLAIKPTLYVDVSSKSLTNLVNVGLDLKGHYLVTTLGDAANFYAAAGATAALSSKNNLQEPLLEQKPNKLSFGAVVELELEFNLSQEVKISIEANQRYLFGSIYGSKWYDISAGLKLYIFNN